MRRRTQNKGGLSETEKIPPTGGASRGLSLNFCIQIRLGERNQKNIIYERVEKAPNSSEMEMETTRQRRKKLRWEIRRGGPVLFQLNAAYISREEEERNSRRSPPTTTTPVPAFSWQ